MCKGQLGFSDGGNRSFVELLLGWFGFKSKKWFRFKGEFEFMGPNQTPQMGKQHLDQLHDINKSCFALSLVVEAPLPTCQPPRHMSQYFNISKSVETSALWKGGSSNRNGIG
ncbi:hypothetical protein TWF694_011619 [Orbilia ellipsospora]|uniref:LAGLIDADG endonuclease n=1 Tax=Orbilia ellipsospora TaxID=2528407 RepID=A0AAV9X6Y0_9PEZI